MVMMMGEGGMIIDWDQAVVVALTQINSIQRPRDFGKRKKRGEKEVEEWHCGHCAVNS